MRSLPLTIVILTVSMGCGATDTYSGSGMIALVVESKEMSRLSIPVASVSSNRDLNEIDFYDCHLAASAEGDHPSAQFAKLTETTRCRFNDDTQQVEVMVDFDTGSWSRRFAGEQKAGRCTNYKYLFNLDANGKFLGSREGRTISGTASVMFDGESTEPGDCQPIKPDL